jgi:hypothetical protein
MPTKGKKQQGADAELGPFEPVSEGIVLAAVDRADRHWQGEGKGPGVTLREVAKHLGFVPGGWTTRQLRPELDVLAAAGQLETMRRHGRTHWAPSKAGRRRLASLRRSGKEPELPESPQHRAWRAARTEAANRIDEFCTELGRDVDNASALLTRHRHVHSDGWFDLRDRLSRSCWRVGSALHCLYEWTEPDDAKADRDDLRDPGDKRLGRVARERIRWLRSGRRNPNSWTGGGYEKALAARPRPRPRLITVPAELVADVRLGLQNELGVPAEAIVDEVIPRADRDHLHELFRAQLEYLDEICIVLDLVGWMTPKRSAAIAIDLRAHRRAVVSALDYAVSSLTRRGEDAEEELEPPKLEAMREHLVALQEFTDAVHRIADELEAEEGNAELIALGRAVRELRDERGLTCWVTTSSSTRQASM